MFVGQVVRPVEDRLFEKTIVYGLTRIDHADLVPITEARTITQHHTIIRRPQGDYSEGTLPKVM